MRYLFLIAVFFLTACSSNSVSVSSGANGVRWGVSGTADRVRTAPSGVPASGGVTGDSSRAVADSYVVSGKRYYVLASAAGFAEEGMASWYGERFHGKPTSSGVVYNMYGMSAAHTRLPLGTYVRVTNLDNGRVVTVEVNDRGPFHDNRVIDLSYAAAKQLDFVNQGTARVRVEAVTSSASSLSPQAIQGSANPLGEVFVQVGAYSQRDNAERTKSRVGSMGIAAVTVLAPQAADAKPLYRVRLGPLPDAEAAYQAVQRLKAVGFPGSRVLIN